MRFLTTTCLIGLLLSSCAPNTQEQAEELVSDLKLVSLESVYICRVVQPAVNGSSAGHAIYRRSNEDCSYSGTIIEGSDFIRGGMRANLATYDDEDGEQQILVSQHFVDTVVNRDPVLESVQNIQ